MTRTITTALIAGCLALAFAAPSVAQTAAQRRSDAIMRAQAGPSFPQGNVTGVPLGQGSTQYAAPPPPQFTKEHPEIVTPASIKAALEKGLSARPEAAPLLNCLAMAYLTVMVRHPEVWGHAGLMKQALTDAINCDAEEAEYRRIDGDDEVDAAIGGLSLSLGLLMGEVKAKIDDGTAKLEGF